MNLLSGGDAELAEALRDVHARVCPTGLQAVGASYGEGALLAARLSDEDRALLASIPVHGGTLLDRVTTWIRKAERLDTIEDLRSSGAGRVQPTAADAQGARSRWIRNAFHRTALAAAPMHIYPASLAPASLAGRW